MVDRARLAESRAAIVTRNTREPIDPGRWNRIQEVLADAIECPREDRDALLDRRCAGDLSLRYEIDSLLHEGALSQRRIAKRIRRRADHRQNQPGAD